MSQRSCWLLPALIVSWTILQFGAALPAHNERPHVPVNAFDASGSTSTIIRQDHDGRAHHPPSGKNETQSSHKLVASPAGLLRPDKFQFYTYNEKGDMITRQMTAQEIQGLIAAGGTDHIVDRQEPQKADDVLTGGKKVMDVVQKVQNVLKSALDKPPTLTGSIPKIPEHANVEWSNILPAILSGEAEAISSNNEPSHSITTERIQVESTPKYSTRKPATPDVQTNAYAGFTNNLQGKPLHSHHLAATEKPMIPVPVITLTEQKLSTLHSAMTESPIFQIISVIPVESVGIKKDQIDLFAIGTSVTSSGTTHQIPQIPDQTEESQTDQYVELALSEVPEDSTSPQLTILNMYPVNITKQTTATSSKVDQETAATYSMITPVTHSSSTKETAELISTTDRLSPSDVSYILVHSKNNTKIPDEYSSFGVTKGSQTHDKIIPQTLATSPVPISHPPSRPELVSKETTPHSPSTLASVTRIKVPTISTSSHAFISDHYLGEDSSTVTKQLSSPVTPSYGEAYLNSLPTEIQSPSSMEPLPTQLVESFSSVINQVSEVKPPVLPLTSPSNERPKIPIMNINYDQRRNVSQATLINTSTSQGANKEIVKSAVNTQPYGTVTTEISSRDPTIELVDYSIPVTHRPFISMDEGLSISTNSRITATTSATSTRIGSTNNKVATNSFATTPAGLKSTSASISGLTSGSTSALTSGSISGSTLGSTLSSLGQLPFETHATVAVFPTGQTESTAIFESIASSEKISTSTASDTKTQSTVVSTDTNLSSNKPTTNEYFDNTLASFNWSDPVSVIDQVLSTAPLPSIIPAIEPIGLPRNASNLAASKLASSLIAGFVTSTSTEKINGDSVKNTSAEYVKLAQQSTENITQKERNVTQSTQETLTDPTRNGTLIYRAPVETKESNDTLEPTKLPSANERTDSTKAPASSPANKFTNDETEDSTGQSATTVGIITVKPEQSSTTTNDLSTRLPGANKTALDASQKKAEIKEKIKTTEAPIVRTDLSPELSPLSVKIVNDTRNSGFSENSTKIEAPSEKNGSFANTSPTKETLTTQSTKNSSPNFYSSPVYSNFTTNVVLNATSGSVIALSKNSTDFAPSQNRVTSTVSYKDKDSTQNKKIENSTVTSPVSIQEYTESSIKGVTQESFTTDNGGGNKGNTFRPYNSANNSSNYNDRNVTESISTTNAPAIKSDGQLNNTESKTASSKHSESSLKPNVTRSQVSTTPSSVPVRQTLRPTTGHKPLEKADATKTDADVGTEDKWTLISQQAPPPMSKFPKPPKPPKPLRKPVNHPSPSSSSPSNLNDNTHIRSPGMEAAAHQDQQPSSTQSLLPLEASQSAIGLDITIRHTSADIVNFAKLCNELAFNFWVATNKGLSTARSLALSPFGMTSLLAMIFLGARGPTSDQMNEVLGLDDVATFNPHLVFQNITDTVGLARGQGIANAAFVRELFADKMKVRKLMPFYKEQAQQFYEGLVTEVNFATISDLVRRRTNLLVRKQTGGRIKDFVKTNTVPLRSPLAALSANVFQTDCNSSLTSSIGRDGELYFAVSPAVRQRKLVPVPATTWRSGVLAGYEPSIDATTVAIGGSDKLVSTIFVLPGQQGHTAPGDNLDRLEQRLVRSAFRDGAWNKLLKVLIPRYGLELQVPKFSHRSVVNATAALKRMGLDELFSGNADFKGINGVGHRLHLADVLQMNLFSTCGDENILNGRHHIETYPASPLRRNVERRMDDDIFDDVTEKDILRYRVSQENEDSYADQSSRTDLFGFYREERQLSGSSERPRLKLDRPFLYFVRHNPSGIILHMGRFNPRLLP
ncbi:hypothetical protein PUN28_001458 [Cardiocondyla obscurior]|uniref:Serpin domain-containing protein n=1 Tax=Cardiocondyla obscurior TaxID=286306 RepID=A0AAW2H510_9HYME